jgi:hypothetical protein
MSAADWTAMAADLADVRADNAVSVVLRRGATTLTAQSVRIAQAGRQAATAATGEMEAASFEMTILGATTLDIQPMDRFTVAGVLYEVSAVAANERAGVRARARMVQ